MTAWVLPALAGAAAGVLSGFGVGGGTLLLLYLTNVAGLAQTAAQAVNLLYFLPTAGAALPGHFKNGFVDKKTAAAAILSGLAATALSAWIATSIDVAILKKLFGVFLIYVGLSELFSKR